MSTLTVDTPSTDPGAALKVNPQLVQCTVKYLAERRPHRFQERTSRYFQVTVTERGYVQVNFLRSSASPRIRDGLESMGFSAIQWLDAEPGWGRTLLVSAHRPISAHYQELADKLMVVCHPCGDIFTAPLSAEHAIVDCASCPTQLHLNTRVPVA